MEMENYDVRVLRHYWKQNYKAAAAKNKNVMLKEKMLWMNVRRSGLNGFRVAI
jgi:very-short-patch-repair endonuclease